MAFLLKSFRQNELPLCPSVWIAFPLNDSGRNKSISGHHAVGCLCKSPQCPEVTLSIENRDNRCFWIIQTFHYKTPQRLYEGFKHFLTLKMKVDDNSCLYLGILIIDEKIFLEVNPPFPSIFPIENPYNKYRFKVS